MHLTPLPNTETGVPGSLWEKRMWIQGLYPLWIETWRFISRAGRLLSTSSCPWRRTLIQQEAVQDRQVKTSELCKKKRHILQNTVHGNTWYAAWLCSFNLNNIWHFFILSFLPGPSWQVQKGVWYIPSVAGILSFSVDCFHPNSITTLNRWTDLHCFCGTESAVLMTGLSCHIDVCHPVKSCLHSKCFSKEVDCVFRQIRVYSLWKMTYVKNVCVAPNVMKIGMCNHWRGLYRPCIMFLQKKW